MNVLKTPDQLSGKVLSNIKEMFFITLKERLFKVIWSSITLAQKH